MKKREIERLKIKDSLECCPEPYRGIPDLSDDYDMSAKIINIKDQKVIDKVMQALNCEEDYKYGPSTSYKGSYSYNRDD